MARPQRVWDDIGSGLILTPEADQTFIISDLPSLFPFDLVYKPKVLHQFSEFLMPPRPVDSFVVIFLCFILLAGCATSSSEPAPTEQSTATPPSPTDTRVVNTATPETERTAMPITPGTPTPMTDGPPDGLLNGDSYTPSISADGRWVAYASYASNLVADDLNGSSDIFLYDRSANETILVSHGLDGAPADGSSGSPIIAPNGSWIAFTSAATNLVPIEKTWELAIYLYNRLDGTISLGSVTREGAPANGWSTSPSLSADGRFLAFESTATNLKAGVNEKWTNIYVHDRQIGQTELVSQGVDGSLANDSSRWPVISFDGRYVAFWSSATTLTSGEPEYCRGDKNPGPCLDIYVFDREIQSMERIEFGQASGLEWGGFELSLSADGRYLAYYSMVYDRQTQSEVAICETAGDDLCGYSPKISSNGRWIAYATMGNPSQIWIYDRQTSESDQISLDPEGQPANEDAGLVYFESGFSGSFELSLDGRLLVFASQATNLIAEDLGLCEDLWTFSGLRPCYGIFLFDRQTGQTKLISHPNPSQAN
jgi:Tol biopolymer transport system component